jgi:hypothetical protein
VPVTFFPSGHFPPTPDSNYADPANQQKNDAASGFSPLRFGRRVGQYGQGKPWLADFIR